MDPVTVQGEEGCEQVLCPNHFSTRRTAATCATSVCNGVMTDMCLSGCVQSEHGGAKLRDTFCQRSRWRDGASCYWPCHRHRNNLKKIANLLEHVLAVQFFFLPRTVSSHVATNIDVSILETLAQKRCKETRTTGHATSRRRRVALPLVEEFRSQLWATRNIFLCCSPSRAEYGDSAQRTAVSKVLECQAEKRGREEPKTQEQKPTAADDPPQIQSTPTPGLMFGHRSRTQQRMCSIFHCLAKRMLQSSCNSLRMAYSSDGRWCNCQQRTEWEDNGCSFWSVA